MLLELSLKPLDLCPQVPQKASSSTDTSYPKTPVSSSTSIRSTMIGGLFLHSCQMISSSRICLVFLCLFSMSPSSTVTCGATQAHFGPIASWDHLVWSTRNWQRRFSSLEWEGDAALVTDLHVWRCLSSWRRCFMGDGLKMYPGRSSTSALILVWLWNHAPTGLTSPQDFRALDEMFALFFACTIVFLVCFCQFLGHDSDR